MNYRKLFAKENESVMERYELAIERVREIADSNAAETGSYSDYFKRVSDFILMMDSLYACASDDKFRTMSLEELQKQNMMMYSDIAGDN